MPPKPAASLPLLSGLAWTRRRDQGHLQSRSPWGQDSSPVGTRAASVPETRKDGGGGLAHSTKRQSGKRPEWGSWELPSWQHPTYLAPTC